jgi:hypothetical protein
MNFITLNKEIKIIMYKLYCEGFPDNYDIYTYDDFFKYNINLNYYYKKANIYLRNFKINKIIENGTR